MIKVSRLFREKKNTPDVLQFLRDTRVKKVAVSPVQEDDELDHE
jgi:hypothetical protein